MSDIERVHKKIRSRQQQAMRVDRCIIIRELDRIWEKHKISKDDTKTLGLLNSINQRLNQSIRKKARRQSHMPKITYPQSLPILQKKDEIIESIKRNQVVVITGETGSGKTTQIPKMCMEAGRGTDGIIGCTQPRRIAAITVSQRIADELDQELGMAVGYKIRFDDKSSRRNYIKMMTDGVLLMETQNDPYLNEYDTIIVDEAHERSINIDFILGILKKLLTKRRDLKLIITSATIDTEKFSRAFHNAPIIEVSGRLYPVEVRYVPLHQKKEEKDDISYIDEAVHAVSSLKKEKRRGDILLFMPTEQDIRETCDVLAAKHYKHTQILPLFARLSAAEQRRVFIPTQAQKIVVATNVAETSITIPGIKYVIDTGLARISEYNPRTRTKSLPIKAISRSSADQRMGRCGRVQDGVCIRLYEEDEYINRHIFTSPEILRSNLAEIILRMIALKLGDISSFPFIDPPNPKNIKDGFDILEELDAIRSEKMKKRKGVVFSLTPKGRMMARLPIDPRISRMIIEAQKEGCVNEVLIIASVVSSQDPRERPFELEAQADQVHKSFENSSSDFITLLNIWSTYHDAWKTMKTQNKMRRFCKKHYLSYRRMREWKDIYNQLSTILQEEGIKGKKTGSLEGESLYTAIHKSILSGYLSNIAVKDDKNIYKKAKGKDVMIFPGSGLFNRGGNWIVAAELIETSRLFARTVATIKVEWLEEIGANFCRYTYSNPRWDKKRGEVVATEQVSLFGLIIVPGRSVSYGRINPREATEVFIRRALVEEEMIESLPFLTHNQDLIRKITTMEDKIRKRDILVSEEDLVRFYETHLSNIYDIRTLRKLIKDRGGDDFLKMKEEDLINYYPGETLSLYPDEVSLGHTCLPCTYRFDPGMPEDGITVNIPASIATSVSLESADWLVPGRRKEKISALIKGLPKQYRKKLVPLADTITTICSEMPHEEGPLVGSLGTFIHARFGVDIPATAWPHETLPDHLKMRFAVIDEKGNEIFASRDVRDLMQRFADEKESPEFTKAQSIWEKEDIDTWDFGTLPESINLKSYGGLERFAFPALMVEDESINIRLFNDRNDAECAHREGTIALFERHFKKEMQYLKKTLALEGNVKTWARYFGGQKKVETALYRKVLRLLFDRPVRSQEAFFAHASSAKPHILPTGQDTLREIEPVLKAYDETRSTLHSLEVAHRSIKPIVTFIASLRDDLNRLMPLSFLDLYDSDRLSHMARYLKAIVIRAQRGITHLEKDEGKFREVKIFEDYLRDFRSSESSHISEIKKKAVDEFAWMVEEYKVSLFAQELKTPFPVSRKRLENRVSEIERIV